MKHSIELKLIYSDKPDALGSERLAHEALCAIVDTGINQSLKVKPTVDLDRALQLFRNSYGPDSISFREGITGGCYGARTGETHEGLTLYVDAELFPERFKDEDEDEVVNLIHTLEGHGTYLESEDPESIHEAFSRIDKVIEENNTYNYAGDSEMAHVLFDADFKVFGDKDLMGKCIAMVKFHHGGDIRGNYGSWHLWSFESYDDVVMALYPYTYDDED